MPNSDCPCGSGQALVKCCQPLIEGAQEATSAEALMRSRYTAFCLKKLDYIVESTDPQTRFTIDLEATRQWAEAQFLKLQILNSREEGNKGVVEFKAHFKFGSGDEEVHHEIAKFRKQKGQWFFHDGRIVAPAKPEI